MIDVDLLQHSAWNFIKIIIFMELLFIVQYTCIMWYILWIALTSGPRLIFVTLPYGE